MPNTSEYKQYYSSSDCTVFAEHPEGLCQPVLLDKLASIGFSESISTQAIYGIGNSKYGFLSKGNLMVNGGIEFNFVDPNYLYTTLYYISLGASAKSNLKNIPVTADLSGIEVSQLTDAEFLAQSAANDKKTKGAYSTSLLDYPQNFVLRIILNNGFLHNKDKNKVILLKGVKIVTNSTGASSQTDDPISQTYNFLAREVSTETI